MSGFTRGGSDAQVIPAFPLAWPMGYPETPAEQRGLSQFKVSSFERSRNEAKHQLELMYAECIVISTNLPLRNDGAPFASGRIGRDRSPGVAIYFTRKGKAYVFACDKFVRIEDNMRAIYYTVEALRTMQRMGASEMMERAFVGFAALPAAGGGTVPWRDALTVAFNATPEDVKRAYRALAAHHHPDHGGDSETFARITRAYEEAQKELNFQ